jgi:hypothetical protein
VVLMRRLRETGWDPEAEAHHGPSNDKIPTR